MDGSLGCLFGDEAPPDGARDSSARHPVEEGAQFPAPRRDRKVTPPCVVVRFMLLATGAISLVSCGRTPTTTAAFELESRCPFPATGDYSIPIDRDHEDSETLSIPAGWTDVAIRDGYVLLPRGALVTALRSCGLATEQNVCLGMAWYPASMRGSNQGCVLAATVASQDGCRVFAETVEVGRFSSSDTASAGEFEFFRALPEDAMRFPTCDPAAL